MIVTRRRPAHGRSLRCRGALAALGALLTVWASPAPAAAAPQRGRDAVIQAVPARIAPVIDGILDDAVWTEATAESAFLQRTPVDGGPPSERTEVRVAFDRDNIYFAFRLHDSEPERIITNELRREGQIGFDDRVMIALDSYNDDRSAYIFEMNSLGTQGDALITDERLVESDWNWEGVYVSEGRIDEEGWTLEVAVPVTTIRFGDSDAPEMGVAFSRTIRRKNEEVVWPPIASDFRSGIFQVSQYARLVGLRDLRRGRNIAVKPYGISGVTGGGSEASDATGDLGVDVKIGLTPSLTLDATYNTDFAQVEADNVQINLTRFSLFFPEKREFFLERAGLFNFGDSGNTQAFFSRRIGLESDIIGGARVTGEVGPVSIGALNLQTDRAGDVPGANNGVLRLRTDPLPRSDIGMIFTNVHDSDGFNRTLGFDAEKRFWSSSSIRGWYATTSDSRPGRRANDSPGRDAGAVGASLGNDRYGLSAKYSYVGANFDPGIGFVQRRDQKTVAVTGRYAPRFDTSDTLRRAEFHFGGWETRSTADVVQSTSKFVNGNLSFESGNGFWVAHDQFFERLDQPFEIRTGTFIPAIDHSYARYEVGFWTNASRRLSGQGSYNWGEFFNGTRRKVNLEATFKQSKHFWVGVTIDRNLIDLPVANGQFTATVASLTLSGAASRKLFGNALVQYDDESESVQANLRIDWIHRPGSDLFLVLDTGYFVGDLGDPHMSRWLRRTAVAKLTYLWQF